MSVTIRAARPTDAGAVGDILSGFIDDTPWMPRCHSRAEDLSFAGLMIDHGWVEVALYQTRIAGFLARNGAAVQALYVRDDLQGRGTGSALLARAQAASEHLSLWTFQANLPAQAFYLKHGFVETTRTDGADNDEGLPDIRFDWTRTYI